MVVAKISKQDCGKGEIMKSRIMNHIKFSLISFTFIFSFSCAPPIDDNHREGDGCLEYAGSYGCFSASFTRQLRDTERASYVSFSISITEGKLPFWVYDSDIVISQNGNLIELSENPNLLHSAYIDCGGSDCYSELDPSNGISGYIYFKESGTALVDICDSFTILLYDSYAFNFPAIDCPFNTTTTD
jgi:hypothetical protein